MPNFVQRAIIDNWFVFSAELTSFMHADRSLGLVGGKGWLWLPEWPVGMAFPSSVEMWAPVLGPLPPILTPERWCEVCAASHVVGSGEQQSKMRPSFLECEEARHP